MTIIVLQLQFEYAQFFLYLNQQILVLLTLQIRNMKQKYVSASIPNSDTNSAMCQT